MTFAKSLKLHLKSSILASPPVCQQLGASSSTSKTLRENDTIEMTCSVDFAGNWAPVMTWTQDDGQTIAGGSVSNVSIPNRNVTYSMRVAATRGMDGKRFTCRIYFSRSNKPSTATAQNVPNYNFTWVSPVLNIFREYLNEAACHYCA